MLSRSSETGENISWPLVVTVRFGFAASFFASLKGTAPMAAKWGLALLERRGAGGGVEDEARDDAIEGTAGRSFQ